MNIAHLLVRAAQAFPDRPAVLFGDHLLYDYGEFQDRVARLAHYLRATRGLRSGDRVAIYMGNRPDYLVILYATLWAGLVTVPINAKLHPREVHYVLKDSEAKLLFVPTASLDDFAPASGLVPAGCALVSCDELPDLAGRPDGGRCEIVHRLAVDLAWLFYTSGTTGKPKGVMLSHRNLMTMTSCYLSDVEGAEGSATMVYAAPLSHGAGLYGFACTLRAGRHVIPRSGGFEPDELIALSRSPGALTMFAAPTMVKRLVRRIRDTGASPEGFRTIVYGGGPMYLQDIREAIDTMGARFVQIYGQGESPMTITVLPREVLAQRSRQDWDKVAASVGYAQAQVELRIADASGNPCPPGQVGEVLVRGDAVMLGYWRNPEATTKALRDGWLWTGDIGAIDACGFLTLLDRSKDVIISGGSNIYPREVEEVLLTHPGVHEVSVVGKPDPEWGEIPVAFVVAEGVDQAALDRHCLSEIARFKRPREYRFVAELPKNNYGKVLKSALRESLGG